MKLQSVTFVKVDLIVHPIQICTKLISHIKNHLRTFFQSVPQLYTPYLPSTLL